MNCYDNEKDESEIQLSQSKQFKTTTRRRRKEWSNQSKIMVLNIVNYFKKRKIELAAKEMNVNKVVAEATGVSINTITKILYRYRLGDIKPDIRHGKKKIKPKIKMDNATEELIRRKLDDYLSKNMNPAVDTIRKELKDEGILKCGRSYLIQLIHSMGYEWKRRRMQKKASPVLANDGSAQMIEIEVVPIKTEIIEESNVSEEEIESVKTKNRRK